MNPGVADRFLDVFSRYIDSGFGLLGGEVAFLASTLVVIDVTLAALFWSWSAGDDVIARLIKKTLYVGFFAFLLSNFNGLAKVVFQSFSGLGLKAAGSGMSAADFLRPGKLAQSGIDAGKPILQSAMQMCGFPQFFDNFPQIAVLMIAWLIVLVAFFVLAVQLFVTLIEFKLTTLAGFVLVPFGLFGRTAFLAERVLGNVVASGVKVLVLAVIVGIGSTYFATFTGSIGPAGVTINQAVSLMLASLALFGLAIFGPGIASGLVAGAPQLGAGSAMATSALAVGGMAMGGAGAAAALRGTGRAGLGAIRAGTSMGSAAATAYRLGQETAGSASIGAGLGGMARATGGAAAQTAGRAFGGLRSAADRGRQAAWQAGGAASSAAEAATAGKGADAMPGWARQLHSSQAARHRRQMAVHAIRDGDRGGAGATPDIKERD